MPINSEGQISAPERRTSEQAEERSGVLRRFGRMIRRDLRRAGRDHADETQAVEDEYTAGRQHDLPGGIPMEAHWDEQNRLQELNQEYLDTTVVNYLDRVLKTEEEQQERKYGKGWFGTTKRWFNETTIGHVTMAAIKGGIVAGAVAVTHATAGLSAPLTNYVARRFGVEAVVELGHYLTRERPVLNQLREARTARVQAVLQLMEERNDLLQRHGNEAVAVGQLTNPWLQAIINELAAAEQQIQTLEGRLTQIRNQGKGIKTIANLGVAGYSLYEMLTGGISMGVQNFDSELPTHQVKMYADGVHFLYNGQEGLADSVYQAMAQGQTVPNLHYVLRAGDVASHTVGFSSQTAAAWGVAGGLWGSMIGGTVYDAMDFNHSRRAAGTSKETAIYSVRERTDIRQTGTELSTTLRDMSPVREESREAVITRNREQMNTGHIYEWTIPATIRTGMPADFPTDTKVLIKIQSKEPRRVAFQVLNRADGKPLNNGKVYEISDNDNIYFNLTKLADNDEGYQQWRERQRQEEQNRGLDEIKRICREERRVGEPVAGQTWIMDETYDLRQPGISASLTLPAGQRVNIIEVKSGTPPIATVDVIDPDTHRYLHHSVRVVLEDLIRHAHDIPTGARPETGRRPEYDYPAIMAEIKKLFNSKIGRAVAANQMWRIGDRWYIFTGINDQSGVIEAKTGEMADTAVRPEAAEINRTAPQRIDSVMLRDTLQTLPVAEIIYLPDHRGGGRTGSSGGR